MSTSTATVNPTARLYSPGFGRHFIGRRAEAVRSCRSHHKWHAAEVRRVNCQFRDGFYIDMRGRRHHTRRSLGPVGAFARSAR